MMMIAILMKFRSTFALLDLWYVVSREIKFMKKCLDTYFASLHRRCITRCLIFVLRWVWLLRGKLDIGEKRKWERGSQGASIVRRGGGSRPGLWGNRGIFVCFFQLQLFLRMIVTDTKTEELKQNIRLRQLWIEGCSWPSDIRMFGDVAAHFSIFLGTWQVLLGRGGNCQMSSVVWVGYVDHEPSWFVVTITGLLEDR